MANKHFFKPLLPGFQRHLTIPVAFFVKYIKGRDEQKKTAKLRSDASKIIWNVKLDGQRLTDGWKEFALAHDLRIGDIVIFRQERDLAFHVTLLGPSCCEIQYGSCLEEESNLEKKEKKSPNEENEEDSCFVANVAPSSLRYDSLLFPKAFVRENGVVTGSGEIVLMNEKGRSWTLKMKQKPSCGTIYIRGGWINFCHANGLKSGDTVTFKMIQRRGTRVLRLLPKEQKEEANDVSLSTEPESDEDSNIRKIQRQRKMKKSPRRDTESSSLDNSCFVASIAPSSLRYDTMYLPIKFMRENGIYTKRGEMILMNQKGRSWTLDLRRKNWCGTFFIKRGWKIFCRANGLSAGSIVTFKLIKKRGTLLTLRLIPNEGEDEESSEANKVESLSRDQESDEESSHDEKISQECLRRNEKKRRLRWTASSAPSKNRFVTLTLTPYNVSASVLRLPRPFTRMNDIDKETKMTLLDKQGKKWSTKLHLEDDKSKRLRMVGGWKGFLQANCVKANESIMLELIWEEDTICVLKFRSKVNL
ncbi:PREDICTED: B3 domain-containing protein REM14-like [Camelina sativa]|uniref:B3 domain-containing protein REM14-like n=1 Tax=Camelina sativa TaxID=90675 RepID=A0ABM0WKQ4_CAMSA|nr:PREDICTED: B3 domain-containing protein REM14-like [Camelina sativa]